MNISSHLYLYKRKWISILLITLIALSTSIVYVVSSTPANFDATLFLSIGYKKDKEIGTSLDNVQAADHFSETVQGWLKNPDFIKRVHSDKYFLADLSASKQEKQNLVITFSTTSGDNADTIADSIVTELKKEIQNYNNKSGSEFQIAIQSVNITENNNKFLKIIIIGLLAGIIFGIALAYFYEFIFGKSSFVRDYTSKER
jgi:capsular polysaccharide biosynthesis protein